jgi:hypothetical protein
MISFLGMGGGVFKKTPARRHGTSRAAWGVDGFWVFGAKTSEEVCDAARMRDQLAVSMS